MVGSKINPQLEPVRVPHCRPSSEPVWGNGGSPGSYAKLRSTQTRVSLHFLSTHRAWHFVGTNRHIGTMTPKWDGSSNCNIVPAVYEISYKTPSHPDSDSPRSSIYHMRLIEKGSGQKVYLRGADLSSRFCCHAGPAWLSFSR